MQVSKINRADLKKYVSRVPEEKIGENKDEDVKATLISESELKPLINLLHAIYTQKNS